MTAPRMTTAPPTPQPHRPYLDEFVNGGWAKRGPGFLREARKEAAAALARRGFPTTRDEAWRHTSVRAVANLHLRPLPGPARPLAEADVAPYRIAGTHELVFVDGHHVSGLSRLSELPQGVQVRSLAAALLKPTEDLEAHLARHADNDEAFIALNTAFVQDGAVVELARGSHCPTTIHVLHVSTEPRAPAASHLRTLVLAGEGSEATIVQSAVGLPAGDPALTTWVTEIVAGPGSRLRHVRLQRENLHAFHFGHVAIRQDRASNVTDLLFSVGAALARNETDAVLGGPGAEVALDGLFLGTGTQHVDNPTRVDHAQPDTTSRELYKGILDGAATGVFLGNVKVRPAAERTNASQTNRNLLLSTKATIDTTPQLEINTDDVKCSHGSTIGQLSRDALFFLRSRGIGEEQARLLLTQAFAHEVLERSPPALQPVLDGLLAQWFACRRVQEAMK